MGRIIRAQRIGKGSPTYRAKGWRRVGEVKLPPFKASRGTVVNLVHEPGRGYPLMLVRFREGFRVVLPAPEGIRVGEEIECGTGAGNRVGNIKSLAEIPEGTRIFNIESLPGDGGKFVRTSGSHGILIAKEAGRAMVQLPSGEIRAFDLRCRAVIGTVSGGGRTEKPFLKAGKRYHALLAKGKPYPRVKGVAMNVVDHPFGGGRGRHAGRPKMVSRRAPPGQKVGLIAARRVGKR
jgi:large subunit ribosomal protein L2